METEFINLPSDKPTETIDIQPKIQQGPKRTTVIYQLATTKATNEDFSKKDSKDEHKNMPR
jgi:hypothetical protein